MDESSTGKDGWSPPEDDYDALNDETFGGDGEEYTWGGTSTIFNDLEKVKSNGEGRHESRKPQNLDSEDMDFGGRVDSPYEADISKTNYDNDFDNENALEESISRLVMDDFDDEEEEMKSKLRRLGTNTNFNTYFLPPQVANKHMQWLKDTELPGQSSLLGSSVWSMHPTSTPSDHAHKPPSSSQMHPDSMNVQINQLSTNRASPGTRNEVHTGRMASHPESIPLNNIFGQVNPHGPSMRIPDQKSQKPVFKTVEEIERELLEGSPPKSSSNEQFNVTPSNNHPRMITAEELERELMETSTPRKNMTNSQITPDQRYSTPPIHTSTPSSFVTPNSKPQHPILQPGTTPFPPQGFGSPSSGRPPPGIHTPPGMNINPMLLQHQQRIVHPGMNLNMMAGGPQGGLAQRISGLPLQFPPNFATQFAIQQQQQLRFLNPHFRGRLPFMMPMGHPMGHPFTHDFPGPGPHGLHSPNNGSFIRPKTDDVYRGLMNEKDKQRLRNIQIIQLQNDHPYTTDYYSLMYKVRHGVSDPKQQREYLLKLFPKKSDDPSNRNSYQPAHFENSLGKLQAVSALAPKKAIDTVIRVVDSGPTNRSGVKAYRYLLLEVEKLYECLLTIQEADIRKTLLLNADDDHSKQRSKCTQKVIHVLQSQDKLSEILCVKKGKMLISRLIPLMEPSVRYSVFSHMIRTFTSWAVGNNSAEIEKTYPFLRHCILAAEMQHLISIVNLDLDPKVYEYMVLSKLGLSLLIAGFHRAEVIISESLPTLTEELIRDWILNAKLFVVSMLVNEAKLPIPVEVSGKILHNLKRFGLNTQELQVFDEKIQHWLTAGSLLMT